MPSIKIQAPFLLDIEQLKTADHLRAQALKDQDLVFFTMHTGSKSAFYRFIFNLGLTQCKRDFDDWKKKKEDE